MWRHGFRWAVEAWDLTGCNRRWGRSLHASSPGTLLTAMNREAVATASQAGLVDRVKRAPRARPLFPSNCLCGRRVEKTLAERIHRCQGCGLIADRDAVSAALAAHLVFDEPDELDRQCRLRRRTSLTRPGTRLTLLEARGRPPVLGWRLGESSSVWRRASPADLFPDSGESLLP